MYKWIDWLSKNRQKVLIGLGVVAAVGVIAGIVTWKKGQDESNANDQLFTYAPVLSSKAPVPSATLQKIATDYPDTSAGEQAELLTASTLFDEGKYAEAQTQFSKFINDHPGSALVPQASVGIAASLEAGGQATEAINKYSELLTRYASSANIASPVKLTLGRLYEEQNKLDMALKNYDDLAKSMNQYDPFAAEARERQVMLLARHPELNKAAPTQSAPTIKMSAPQAPGATPTPAPGVLVSPKQSQ